MTHLAPTAVRVSNPLSEVTRNERRSLLAISTLGLILVQTGLVPTKIEALGVEFTTADQRAILSIVALGTLYFLVAFAIYAASDYVVWRLAYRESVEDLILKQNSNDSKPLVDYQTLSHRLGLVDRVAPRFAHSISIGRTLFEFVLPILFGIFVIFLLFTTPIQSVVAPPVSTQSPVNSSVTVQATPTP